MSLAFLSTLASSFGTAGAAAPAGSNDSAAGPINNTVTTGAKVFGDPTFGNPNASIALGADGSFRISSNPIAGVLGSAHGLAMVAGVVYIGYTLFVKKRGKRK
ncbi:MAG: hypothetical protein JKY86_07665 [Gammaproteobacteria bacterium]|nr:hypothetical protein [Gammaproteobacteria bacterium]MBL4572936.1 hypothetical protein [Gammaproteobacteria bacterium]